MNDLLDELRDKTYDTGYYAAVLEKVALDHLERGIYEALQNKAIAARTAAFNELERRLAAAERMAEALEVLLTEFGDAEVTMDWLGNEWPEIKAARAALAEWRAANGDGGQLR